MNRRASAHARAVTLALIIAVLSLVGVAASPTTANPVPPITGPQTCNPGVPPDCCPPSDCSPGGAPDENAFETVAGQVDSVEPVYSQVEETALCKPDLEGCPVIAAARRRTVYWRKHNGILAGSGEAGAVTNGHYNHKVGHYVYDYNGGDFDVYLRKYKGHNIVVVDLFTGSGVNTGFTYSFPRVASVAFCKNHYEDVFVVAKCAYDY
jgi:hypothetical protein